MADDITARKGFMERLRDSFVSRSADFWKNYSSLPSDVSLNSSEGWRRAFFKDERLHNFIVGEKSSRNGEPTFSFSLFSYENISHVGDILRDAGLDSLVSVRKDEGTGAYSLVGKSLNDVVTAARRVYPPLSCHVSRNSFVVDRYAIPGCMNKTQALLRFSSSFKNGTLEKDGISLVRHRDTSYYSYSSSVKKSVTEQVTDRSLMENDNLFFIDLMKEHNYGGIYLPVPQELSLYSAKDKVRDDIILLQAINRNDSFCSRYVICSKTDVLTHSEARNSDLSNMLKKEEFCMCLYFTDANEFENVLSGKKKINPFTVSLYPSMHINSKDDECGINVFVPLKDNIDSLRLNREVFASVLSRDSGMSIDDPKFKDYFFETAIKGRYMVFLESDRPLDFTNATVNGLSMDEYEERRTNKIGADLSYFQFNQCLYESSRIKDVSVSIDNLTKELVVRAKLKDKDGLMEELPDKRVPLTKEQEVAIRGRELSHSDLKDLVMHLHPDKFRSYSYAGEDFYIHPVDSVIKGEKPLCRYSRSQDGFIKAETKKAVNEPSLKKTAGVNDKDMSKKNKGNGIVLSR
jgi:hypothetical protein